MVRKGHTMEETKSHIDNDIVNLKEKSYDYDIDNVDKRAEVLKEISEYKLNTIQSFMFGRPCKNYGDCVSFINPAIKQIERFAYTWMTELSEDTRKTIINYYLGHDGDKRTREYKEYTNTPIWKFTSCLMKFARNYTCESCGKRYNPAHLVVHHRTYEHLGSELDHGEDLAVLCTDCHLAVHGIERGNYGE